MLRSVIDFVTTPSTLFLLLILLALIALLLHWRRTAITSLTLGLTGFVTFGFTSLSEVMIAPLVTRFPPVDLAEAEPPYGLIVLGAGLNEVHARHNGALLELEDGGEAVPTAALLAQRYPDARIILSGGSGTNFPPEPLRGVDGMRRVLMEFGVAADRIMIDPNAATTAARARNTLDLIGEDADQIWWAITPAHRMPRLIGSYRALGFEPVPYPVDFKWIPPFDPTYFYDFSNGLRLTDAGAHEWRGLLFYYLTGRTETFFPGPITP
ncbi:YdcF family protein [Cognatiyoonia sp. IB215446]|uniref:YdcF family protein n=1 Tax=Cognatiyoonia sp. IB215446 TaxID=3097355 RepID=UPI002A16A276|nr:YdcF family protein [Cognatiyoonia sp. IB215446]MDX8349851.1 YdcF family protein [Cognatiyoonia sp. IB215446]